MNRELKNVKIIFDVILEHNKKIVDEVAASSGELFGGTSVKIPPAGGHRGQKGWANVNAWDIPAPIGTPVYAVADGVAKTFTDHGRSIKKVDGKKLYGQSFTVESDGPLPDVYYTHLEGSPISKGDKIECGQFLGYIMDMPGSSYDHLHIGVEYGDISQFLTKDGKLKCGGGTIFGTIDSEPTSVEKSDDSSSTTDDIEKSKKEAKPWDSALFTLAGEVGKNLFGLKENFGRNIQSSYGTISIPGSSNSKIKSPIDGVVKSRYDAGCTNQILIESDTNPKYYLQYCGVTKRKVGNGEKVSVGQVIAEMSNDAVAEVVFLDSSFNRKDLNPNKLPDSKNKKTEYRKDKQQTYWDAGLAGLIGLPKLIFGNVYDKETGKLKTRKWSTKHGSEPVDPWILNAIKKPFQKKKTDEEEKLEENIKRIKNLLK